MYIDGQWVKTNVAAWRPGFFSTKAAAIRCGVAFAKRSA